VGVGAKPLAVLLILQLIGRWDITILGNLDLLFSQQEIKYLIRLVYIKARLFRVGLESWA
jgi:hypothetical protein